MIHDLLHSRGFWTLLLALVAPVLQLLDATDKVEPVTVIILAFAGFFGVTVVRRVNGDAASYAARDHAPK